MRVMCDKDKHGNHSGTTTCFICKKDFTWTEGENAEVVVREVSIEGQNVYLDLNAIAKCPHCYYRYTYLASIRRDEFR